VTAAEIHGPWIDLGWDSSLIDRVRRYWSVPIADIPDAVLALFLRQRIAIAPVLAEARRRLCSGRADDSELYDGELAAAVDQVGTV
jgi:hypothetical protein